MNKERVLKTRAEKQHEPSAPQSRCPWPSDESVSEGRHFMFEKWRHAAERMQGAASFWGAQ